MEERVGRGNDQSVSKVFEKNSTSGKKNEEKINPPLTSLLQKYICKKNPE